RGVADLLDELMKVLPEISAVAKYEIGGPRRVAILGRPNVGKSSLLNKAAGEERVVVNELAARPATRWTRSSSSAASSGRSSTPPASVVVCTCSRA
ncbi:GTPase, partial [Salmonella enterica]